MGVMIGTAVGGGDRMRVRLAALVVFLAAWGVGPALAADPAPEEGSGRAEASADEPVIGARPTGWTLTDWMHPGADGGAGDRDDGGNGTAWPGTLAALRGKVVLIRWWTAPGCPYCRASAPALNAFHERYGGRGLQVVGAYHHKAEGPVDPARVASAAEALGFRFPVGIDRGWRTLDAWWLSRRERAWTSVTFLLDRDGVVRFVHPGGQFVEGDGAFEELDAAIRRLLEEPDAATAAGEPQEAADRPRPPVR